MIPLFSLFAFGGTSFVSYIVICGASEPDRKQRKGALMGWNQDCLRQNELHGDIDTLRLYHTGTKRYRSLATAY